MSTWSIQRRSGWRGALSYLGDVLRALEYIHYFDFIKSPEDVRLPPTTQEEMELEPALIEGNAAFMPKWAGRQAMSLYSDRATISVSSGFSSVERPIPLSDFRIAKAKAPRRRWFPKCATAEWELVLINGEQRVVISGTWLTLAWLGSLGGWDEPEGVPCDAP